MKENDKLNRLYQLLRDAKVLSSAFSGGYSNHFASAEQFYVAFSDSIAKLTSGDLTQLHKQYFWFAPTCDWDDLIGKDGQALGNEIFELLTALRKHK
jgi:hypothetical protein